MAASLLACAGLPALVPYENIGNVPTLAPTAVVTLAIIEERAPADQMPPATSLAQAASPVPSTATATPTATSRPTTITPTDTATPPATSTKEATATQIAATTATPIPATAIPELRPPPSLVLSPGDPLPYLETYRLVTFYGSPPGPALGVLGAGPRDVMLAELRAIATQYQPFSEDRTILPTYHLVVTIADPWAGPDGDYNHWMNETLMEDWLDAAQDAGVAVILDIQPGYADVMVEFQRLRPYLYRPHVNLALDSEFTMSAGGIPGRSLGQIGPAHINPIQQQLDAIAQEIGINKVLILHQFDPSMLVEKEGIVDYPHVELVIDADGFGSPRAKTEDYLQYAGEPGFEYGGFKLFFGWDLPLMAPSDVMSLEPAPAIIIYQ